MCSLKKTHIACGINGIINWYVHMTPWKDREGFKKSKNYFPTALVMLTAWNR